MTEDGGQTTEADTLPSTSSVVRRTMTIRIAIIGAGSIAEHAFLPGFAEPGSRYAQRAMGGWAHGGTPGAKVVMLASRGREKLQRLASEFDIPQVSTDWRDATTNSEVDAVCIATPNYLHAEMTIAASRAGKHVLVEKPMAATMREANEMVAAADEANVVLMVQQSQRFFPVHEVAKQIVDAGALGKILSVRSRYGHAGPENWSPGGKWFFKKDEAIHGALFDLGIHKFDLIRFLAGKEAAEVSAFTDTLAKDIEVEDYGVTIIRFTDRALGVVEASWATNPEENSLKLYSANGNLQIGVDSVVPLSVEFNALPNDALKAKLPRGEWRDKVFIPQIPKDSITGGPFRHFVDCIVNATPCIASGADNRKSLAIALAAFESNEQRRAVTIYKSGWRWSE